MNTFATIGVHLQTGEYATDEEEEMSPMFPNSIEVFDLAENQEALSPVELDPEKLAHKFKEVFGNPKEYLFGLECFFSPSFLRTDFFVLNLCTAPNQTRCDPGRDPAAEEEGESAFIRFHSLLKTLHRVPL